MRTKKELAKRYLSDDIESLALLRNKMAFVSGPRQCGKTTLSKMIKNNYDQAFYQNWDESTFRKIWHKDAGKLIEEFNLNRLDERNLLILDEIHKSKGWKQKLKGLYDVYGDQVSILVTGSARLNIYKKGSDSLLGRYLNFRLHPFSLAELLGMPIPNPEKLLSQLFFRPAKISDAGKFLDKLFEFGPFPEPLFGANKKVWNLWNKGRVEKIVREDLRDLSRLPDLDRIEVLMALLPEKIGSPLSVSSLREDFEVAHDTIKRWLYYLKELYYFYDLRPYTKSIVRSIKKEPKIYLFDWSEISEPGPRFENMIANHLLKACHYWEDVGEGSFQINYLRNKEKQEVDLVITKDKKPWFMIECKLSGDSLAVEYKNFQKYLDIPYIQVVKESKIWRRIDEKTLIISAEYFLPNLI